MKGVIKQILRFLFPGYKIVKDKKESFIENKHVECGNLSDIRSAKFNFQNIKDGKIAVKVGENCLMDFTTFSIENGEGSIKVGDRTYIGPSLISSLDSVNIGSDVMVSWGCTIIDNDSHSTSFDERKMDVQIALQNAINGNSLLQRNWSSVNRKGIIIEDKAWIGFNSTILKGVVVGEGAIVGCGSVVTKSVDPYTIVAGNPAKVIKKLSD